LAAFEHGPEPALARVGTIHPSERGPSTQGGRGVLGSRSWQEQTPEQTLTVVEMAKLTMPAEAAEALSVRERLVLFCVASCTDWQHIAGGGETVTGLVVKGLIERDAAGVLALTDRGRAILRAMLPDL
jgi:hypothetical protein